jgi:hypothetical protein
MVNPNKPIEQTERVNLFTDFIRGEEFLTEEQDKVIDEMLWELRPHVSLLQRIHSWWLWKLNNFPGDDGTKGNALLIAVLVTWTVAFLVGLPYIAYLMYRTVGAISTIQDKANNYLFF